MPSSFLRIPLSPPLYRPLPLISLASPPKLSPQHKGKYDTCSHLAFFIPSFSHSSILYLPSFLALSSLIPSLIFPPPNLYICLSYSISFSLPLLHSLFFPISNLYHPSSIPIHLSYLALYLVLSPTPPSLYLPSFTPLSSLLHTYPSLLVLYFFLYKNCSVKVEF